MTTVYVYTTGYRAQRRFYQTCENIQNEYQNDKKRDINQTIYN